MHLTSQFGVGCIHVDLSPAWLVFWRNGSGQTGARSTMASDACDCLLVDRIDDVEGPSIGSFAVTRRGSLPQRHVSQALARKHVRCL